MSATQKNEHRNSNFSHYYTNYWKLYYHCFFFNLRTGAWLFRRRRTFLNRCVIDILFSICRSDEDDPSGSKYRRMEDDNIQDKERFARYVYKLLILLARTRCDNYIVIFRELNLMLFFDCATPHVISINFRTYVVVTALAVTANVEFNDG